MRNREKQFSSNQPFRNATARRTSVAGGVMLPVVSSASRRIKTPTSGTIAVRLLTGATQPDHDSICKFRRENAVGQSVSSGGRAIPWR